jgi:selenide, water dikinase
LAQVLRPAQNHPATTHADLVIGMGRADDAGVYSLGDGRVLVQTVDIFTPVVDGARDWGRIAAANALSDIYAMGATPLTALNYLAWPREELPFELAGEVLLGGLDIMANAGCTVIGGHSIDSPEPSFGYAVTGVTGAGEVVALAGARPGDKLVLTKPLGIGIITTAIKRGKCPPGLAEAAIEQMAALNDLAGKALSGQAHAATDVTGFGLLGHLREMCEASDVGAVIDTGRVPVLPGARDLLEQGAWAGGSQRNLEALSDFVLPTEIDMRIYADAQTSGGLLVALGPGENEKYVARVPGAVVIGEVTERAGIELR